MEPVEETYTKAFVKEFGLIDPDQDWNMATRASVTVTTASATEMKVYAKTDEDNYRLVGDFGGVSGTQTLEFDVPRGTTDIRVSNGTYAYDTTVGGEVSFANASSRSASINSGDGTTSIKVAYLDENDANYEIIFKENTNDETNSIYTGVYRYQQELSEGKWNAENEGVSKNFYFKSDGEPFVLYPVYWQTDATTEVGIAYKDANGDIQTTKVYIIKSGEELRSGTTSSKEITIGWDLKFTVDGTEDCLVNLALGTGYHDKNISDLTDVNKTTVLKYINQNLTSLKTSANWQSNWNCDEYTTIETNNDAWNFVVTGTTTTWAAISATPSAPDDSGDGTTQYKSRGIEVTVPSGLEYCFYVKNNTYTMYTRQEWNTDEYKNSDGTADSSKRALHGATYTLTENGTTTRCLAFEDWYGSGSDVDLNDLVFYTTLATETTTTIREEDNPQAWILAAEDLGDTDDFDFNDMVIKVTTPTLKSGSTDTYEVKVTALAAGGTLPLKLKWTNPNTSDVKTLVSPIDNKSEQFHSWFGSGDISTSTMINTTSNDTKGKTYTLELTSDDKDKFSMSSCSDDVANKMGGFTFEVERTDGTYTTITAPKEGEAPQMMCLPDTWKWPRERVNISTAYPDFGTWGAYYTNGTWIDNCKSSYVVN